MKVIERLGCNLGAVALQALVRALVQALDLILLGTGPRQMCACNFT
jgi:hypothetical protein